MKFISTLIAFLFFTEICHAESFLCEAEAGAGVENKTDGRISSGLVNVIGKKYILSKDEGKWNLKVNGLAGSVLFDKCESIHYCERSGGYAGNFIMNNKNIFTLIWLTNSDDGGEIAVMAKGRCVKNNT